MRFLRKYLVAYRLGISRELTYRVNFFFGQLRFFLVFFTLIYFVLALGKGVGMYSEDQLITYYIFAGVATNLIMADAMESISNQIAEGDLSNYLLRPINYFGYWSARLLGTRTLTLVATSFGMFLLTLVPRVDFFIQTNPVILLQSAVLLCAALVIVDLLKFSVSFLAFWANRAFGPRWLLVNLLLFMTGLFIPVDLFPDWFQRILWWTPFPRLVYGTTKAYLGVLAPGEFEHMLLMQLAWVVILFCVLTFIWRRGVKSYEAYGG